MKFKNVVLICLIMFFVLAIFLSNNVCAETTRTFGIQASRQGGSYVYLDNKYVYIELTTVEGEEILKIDNKEVISKNINIFTDVLPEDGQDDFDEIYSEMAVYKDTISEYESNDGLQNGWAKYEEEGKTYKCQYIKEFKYTYLKKLAKQYSYIFKRDNGSGSVSDIYIWNLYEKIEEKQSYANSIYCLRGGYGFHGLEKPNQATSEEYNKFLDMTEKIDQVKALLEDNNMIKNNDSNYNAVLWIIDNMYLPNCVIYNEDNTENTELARSEMRKKLLTGAFNGKEEFMQNGKIKLDRIKLSDNDIEVIQQLAIWYFTNGYDSENDAIDASYKNVSDSFALFLKGNNETEFIKLDDLRKKEVNDTISEEAKTLYNYLITTAQNNANTYTSSNKEALNIDLTKEGAKIEEPIGNTGYYLAGPFTIKYNSGDSEFEADFSNNITTKNDSQIENIGTLVVKNNGAFEEKTIKEIIQAAIDNTEKNFSEFYIKINETELYNITTRSNEVLKKLAMEINVNNTSINTKATFATSDVEGAEIQPLVIVEKEVLQPVKLNVELEKEKEFDLALRKYITKIEKQDGTQTIPEGRTPVVSDLEKLVDETATTATYTHNKTHITVEKGDKVIYEIRVYNEGEVDGYATKIEDYLPEGLKLVEKSNSAINTDYGWKADSQNPRIITTEYLKEELIISFNKENKELSSKVVQVECIVEQTAKKGALLTNIAQIAGAKDINGKVISNEFDDRDSEPNNVTKPTDEKLPEYKENQQDDDDFEKIIIETEPFDLALRKFITKINGIAIEESREPKVNIDDLKNGKAQTATYTHSKEPLKVQKGDIVEYTLRVYNEGQIDGYATEITDYLPEGLGLVVGYNENSWIEIPENSTIKTLSDLFGERAESLKLDLEKFDSEKTLLSDTNVLVGPLKIVTEGLKNQKIEKFNGTKLDHKDITVTCIVLTEDTEDLIRNIAEISKARSIDELDETINTFDIDSKIDNVNINEYIPPVDNSTYQEDDDDYELLSVQYFDLALRKFITKVNTETITTRIPKFVLDKTTEKISYEHDKTPVYVANGDVVEYTIRVYNEGKIDGYAEEIKDNIPEGLIYLPDNQTNKDNGWKIYYLNEKEELVETDDVTKATIIKTTNLSELKGTMINKENEKQVNSNLIKAFKKDNMDEPIFKEVRVAFKVTEEKLSENRIIKNIAEISEDSDFDIDSTPDNDNETEDDIDKEYIYVKYFDLSLLKWVSKAIVTVDGTTTITETGYNGLENPEPIVKVDVKKNKMKSTTVKFVYTIKITNEGEIAGYANEITDYIPTGLKFVEEDNPDWKKEDDTKITTTKLDTTLLKPGETSTVDVTFTWINGADNIGIKTNIAEISQDKNDFDAHDIDSVPDNKKEGEDDIDKALVMLAISTGTGKLYIALILTIFIMLGTGVYFIKRFVI